MIFDRFPECPSLAPLGTNNSAAASISSAQRALRRRPRRKSPAPVPLILDLAGKRGRESPTPDSESAGIGNWEIPRFPIGRKSGNRGYPAGVRVL